MFEQAIEIAHSADGSVRFWAHGDDVFRTTGAVPGFDIYGRPMGARWECDSRHWARYRAVYGWAVDCAPTV